MGGSIIEVAKRAGVSPATVSRVMNHPEAVDDKKIAAVKEAIEFYQYQPNQFGRGLVKQNSRMIGVYFTYGGQALFDVAYNLELLKGIQSVLDRQDYSMVLIHEEEGKEKTGKFMSYVSQKKIDGLILSSISPESSAKREYDRLLDDGYPMVYIGRKFHQNGLNVYAQYEKYMYQMLRELFLAGHRKILVFDFELHNHYLRDVYDRVKRELPELQVIFELQQGMDFLKTRSQIFHQVNMYVLEQGCTAVCGPAMEDMPFLLGIFKELNLNIPQDVSVIGVEHREGAGESLFPGVSAFSVPAREMGEAAAKMLIQRMEGQEPKLRSWEFDTGYKRRQSVMVIPS